MHVRGYTIDSIKSHILSALSYINIFIKNMILYYGTCGKAEDAKKLYMGPTSK